MESYTTTLEPLPKEPSHLWRVGHVVVDELAPDGRDGHEVGVRDVGVGVHGQRDTSEGKFYDRISDRDRNVFFGEFKGLLFIYLYMQTLIGEQYYSTYWIVTCKLGCWFPQMY